LQDELARGEIGHPRVIPQTWDAYLILLCPSGKKSILPLIALYTELLIIMSHKISGQLS
jgi:hypothetical protein